MRPFHFSLLSVLLLAPLSGCDLSEIGHVTFALPVRSARFDASTQNLGLPPTLPTIACTTPSDCCGGTCPSGDIQVSCNASVCGASAPFVLVDTIDLSMVPNLKNISRLANVTLTSLRYAVCENTFNTPIPSFELWLAPSSVSTPNTAAGAKKVGTVAMVPASTDVKCPASGTAPDIKNFAEVTLETDAPATFSQFAQNVSTPFHVLAVGRIAVRSGDPTPAGGFTVLVSGQADARLK